jgi:FtsP/CotA-like multicopper oxidase with cupredoxin domain
MKLSSQRSPMVLILALFCIALATLVPISPKTNAAFASESEGLLCTDGAIVGGYRTFNLVATDGYNSEPDGNSIYDWSYGVMGKGFQLPGPILCVNTGEVVDITLTNQLPVATSIQLPGFTNVTYNDGSQSGPVGPVFDPNGVLISLVPQVAPGFSITYRFKANNAGTYVYQSGTDPQLQVQMGLFGAIIVRPSGISVTADDVLNIPYYDGTELQHTNADAGMTADEASALAANAKCAYPSLDNPTKCDPLAIYDGSVDGENILILSEIDPAIHTFIEQAMTSGDLASLNWNSYPTGYEAHYFMINGRSMPDTLAPNNAPWMPWQPYGAMAHVQPWDVHVNALDALLRYINVGNAAYDFHPHSNHEHVIAQDSSLMKGITNGVVNDNTEEKFNILINPGGTVDATFRWTNEESYDDVNGFRVPVAPPNGPNLNQGDYWSGSPYLGVEGLLNPGVLTKSQCGEYYHVAHNHDLTQVTNYGLTFGGMMTLIKVEPPAALQTRMNLKCN